MTGSYHTICWGQSTIIQLDYKFHWINIWNPFDVSTFFTCNCSGYQTIKSCSLSSYFVHLSDNKVTHNCLQCEGDIITFLTWWIPSSRLLTRELRKAFLPFPSQNQHPVSNPRLYRIIRISNYTTYFCDHTKLSMLTYPDHKGQTTLDHWCSFQTPFIINDNLHSHLSVMTIQWYFYWLHFQCQIIDGLTY